MRDGVIAHVRGDPHHPVSRGKLCPKCSIGYNREWRDPHARLTRPLRRVGPKGEGRFEPVSWDTALAASFLEFNDLVAGYFHLSLSAQVKAMEPLGEALPNQEIFRRLARAMGYTEPELYERDAAILATVLRQANLGVDFPALAATGSVPVSPRTAPPVR
jgi:anaerobic selenocysteine-containing dehydrogenase